jgi:hypothetical protein
MRVVAANARALAASAVLSLASCASPPPALVNPVFADRRPPAALLDATPTCELHIASLTDVRRAPETLGMIRNRAVKAPANSQQWLRSIVQGLQTRGFTVDFDQDGTPARGSITMAVSLEAAWVGDGYASKKAHVVLRVEAEGRRSATLNQDYTGSLSISYWVGDGAGIQGLVDKAIERALDAMTPDLHRICGS